MAANADNVHRVTFNLLQNCLVGTLQADLDSRVLGRFQEDLLARLQESRSPWLVLDCSGVEVLDLEDFNGLRRVIAMADLMGTKTIIAGLRPGVVSSLIQLDADTAGLDTALNLASALTRVLSGCDSDDGDDEGGEAEKAEPEEAE